MQFRFVILGLVLAIGIIAGLTFWPDIRAKWFDERRVIDELGPNSTELSDALTADPSSALPAPEAPAIDQRLAADVPAEVVSSPDPLPALNESDAWLRANIPTSVPAPWEDESELLRIFVAVLDNAPRGDYPRNLLGFLAPSGKFRVLRSGDQIRLDPISYDRYNPAVAALTDLSPETMAGLYVRLGPLLREALQELGVGDGQPIELAIAAIRHVQATPILAEPPLLVQPKVIFKFADARLEKLSPLQKQLLRMGPANLGVVKRWLGQFVDHLD